MFIRGANGLKKKGRRLPASVALKITVGSLVVHVEAVADREYVRKNLASQVQYGEGSNPRGAKWGDSIYGCGVARYIPYDHRPLQR